MEVVNNFKAPYKIVREEDDDTLPLTETAPIKEVPVQREEPKRIETVNPEIMKEINRPITEPKKKYKWWLGFKIPLFIYFAVSTYLAYLAGESLSITFVDSKITMAVVGVHILMTLWFGLFCFVSRTEKVYK